MKLFFAFVLLAAVGCGAIHDADRQVNKMTDHRTSRDESVQNDGGASQSPSSDGGTDSAITSM